MNQTNVISILSRSNMAGLNAATEGLKRHQSALQSVIGTAAGAGKAAYSATANIAGLAGAAVVAFTGASINAAAQFGEQLAIINTVARTTPQNLAAIGDGIRRLAAETGEPLATLTQGYYDLLSAGISAADAQGVLSAAATLGIGGLATTAESVDLLTTAINAWGMKASDATRISDTFAVAIDKGKVTAAQIAGSLFNVASTAANAGIEISEVSAAYATMSAAGIPAEQLTVAMRSAILSLQNPTKALSEAQAELGVNFAAIAKERGLHEAYRLLVKYSEDTGIPLLKLTGRVEAQQYAFAVAGETADEFNTALAATTEGLEGNGHAALQAAQRMNTLPRAMGQLKASIADLMIEWGDAFLPGLIAGVQSITGIVQAITAWMKTNRELVRSWAPVISIVSSIFALRTGMQGLMLMFGRFLPILGGMGGGFSILGTALTKLAFPVGLLVLAWNLFDKAVDNNWAGMNRYRTIVMNVQRAVSSLLGVVTGIAGAFGRVFGALGGGDLGKIAQAWDDGMFLVEGRVNKVKAAFGRLADSLKGPFMAVMNMARLQLTRWGIDTRVLEAVIGTVVGAVGEFIEAASRLAQIVLPSLARAAGWLFRTLAPIALMLGVTLIRALTGVMNVAATFLEWLNGTTAGADLARRALGQLMLAALSFYALVRVSQLIMGTARAIATMYTNALNAAQSVVDLGRALGRIGSKAVSLAVNGAQKAWDAVTLVADGIKKLASKTVSLAVDGARAAADAVSTLVEKMGALKDKSARVSITGTGAAGRAIDGLLEKLGAMGTKALDVKLTVTEGFNPASIVNGLLQGIGLGISTKGGPVLAKAMAVMLTRVAPLIAAVGGGAVVGIAVAIVAAIGAAILAPDIVGALGGWILGAIAGALANLTGLAFMLVGYGVGLAEGLLNGIAQGLMDMGKQVNQWIKDRLAEIDIDILGFLNLDELLAPFANVLDKVTALWDEFWSGEFDIGAIGKAFLDLGGVLAMLPVDIVVTIGSWILARLIDVGAWVLARGGDALAWIGEWVGSIPGRVAEWWAGLQWPTLNLDFLPDVDLGAWWDEISGNFAAKFGEVWAAVTGPDSPAGQFIAFLGNDVGPALQGFETWWNDLWARISSWVGEKWNDVVRATGDAVAAIINAIVVLEEAMPGEDNAFAQSLRAMRDEADSWGETTKVIIDDVGAKVTTGFDTMATKPVTLADAMDAAVVRTAAAKDAAAHVMELMQSDQYTRWKQMEGTAGTSSNTIATTTGTNLGRAATAAGTHGAALSANWNGGVNNPQTRSGASTAGSAVGGATTSGMKSGGSGAWSGGWSIAWNWISGVTTYLWNTGSRLVTDAVNWVKGIFGGSLPEHGPLAGSTAFDGGSAIMASWVDGMWSQRDRAVSLVGMIANDVQAAFAPSLELVPVTASDGSVIMSGGISRGMVDDRAAELMAAMLHESRIQNELLARMATNDADLTSPLAARSQLEVLRQADPVRRGRR